MYTNKTVSNLNLNLYSKQVGGKLECIKKCKTKCAENCGSYCRVAAEDTYAQSEEFARLVTKRDALKLQSTEAENIHRARIIDRITASNQNPDLTRLMAENPAFLPYLRGGKRKRTKRQKRRRGGFFLGNTSKLRPCEQSCTTDCSKSCDLLCTNAISQTSGNSEKMKALKDEITLYEKIIALNT
jgi:hypothetical protein